MTINNATVEQINVALLDMDKRIKALNIDNEAIKSLQNSIKTIKSSLNEAKAGLTSGATYNSNISGNASTATHATTATTAEIVSVAESADEANHAKVADNISAGGTSGQVLTSNGSSAAPSWQNQKTQTVKFVDYKTESLTFSSLTDQKKIELSNFGPEVTENNVLSFMVIYWREIPVIAQADWAKSQGTGSSGLSCALHSLNNGTGWCVIRCVYLA